MTPASGTKNAIFLTGATGFLGSYLLKIFLKNDHRVFVLARSKNGINGRTRIVQTLKFWDKTLLKKIHNLTVVEGDIRQKNLALG
ncbi:MAG TPA: SDR family oxidoreductase, partial [Candidatus Omnitrophota bacterium]|nr:SDR family oxidoreductase [Candidatus Omnitrophota bacterium]